MTDTCVVCCRPIKPTDILDETGMAHLACAVEALGGCEHMPGVFVPCWACWRDCPYRCCPPVDEYVEWLKEEADMI